MWVKIKKKYKESLLIKIAKQKRKIKIYEKEILERINKEQDYIDKISLLQDDIRSLTLKLTKEDREFWLKERNEKNERHTPKKKRVKKELNEVKNN